MRVLKLPGALQVVVGVDGAARQVEGVAHGDPESRDVEDGLLVVVVWKSDKLSQLARSV